MATTSPIRHYPGEVKSRPRGILKNPSSSNTVPQIAKSPGPSTIPQHSEESTTPFDEKELTIQNTLQNAGRRRSSVEAAHRLSISRRQSSATNAHDEASQRLKWDEANLYLAEQNKSATMKITEPKTPYARQYDPAEDEEMIDEDPGIDVSDIVVDEKEKAETMKKRSANRMRESDIPGLELGEPEEAVDVDAAIEADRIYRSNSHEDGRSSSGEKHVSVGEGDAELPDDSLSREDVEKHKKFEEMRKKHYEMKNVRGLLGHPEEVMNEDDEDDAEDDEDDQQAPPPIPSLPSRPVNGQ